MLDPSLDQTTRIDFLSALWLIIHGLTILTESDSTVLTSNQSSRRTSTGACSGLLIREDLARDLNIVVNSYN
jgi:hypothetical protein